jgi:hypothetical protein
MPTRIVYLPDPDPGQESGRGWGECENMKREMVQETLEKYFLCDGGEKKEKKKDIYAQMAEIDNMIYEEVSEQGTIGLRSEDFEKFGVKVEEKEKEEKKKEKKKEEEDIDFDTMQRALERLRRETRRRRSSWQEMASEWWEEYE